MNERELEIAVGDLLHRRRAVDRLLHEEERIWYGYHEVRLIDGKVVLFDVDGVPLTPIDIEGKGTAEVQAKLDERLAEAVDRL